MPENQSGISGYAPISCLGTDTTCQAVAKASANTTASETNNPSIHSDFATLENRIDCGRSTKSAALGNTSAYPSHADCG